MVLGMFLTMVTGKVKDICYITFQCPDNLGQQILILIIVLTVRDTLRPPSEGFTHIYDVAGLTIKLGNLYHVSNSRFLLIMATITRGTGETSRATEASSLQATVTHLILRPLFILLSPADSLARLHFRSGNFSSGSFIIREIERPSHLDSLRHLLRHKSSSLRACPCH